jgi:hypothetical protein
MNSLHSVLHRKLSQIRGLAVSELAFRSEGYDGAH